MDDMLSRISEILNNPEAAQKLKEIVSSMGENNSPKQEKQIPVDLPLPVPVREEIPNNSGFNMDKMSSVLAGLNGSSGNNKNIVLLNAIKPFMRQTRADKISNAIRAIQVINIMSNFK